MGRREGWLFPTSVFYFKSPQGVPRNEISRPEFFHVHDTVLCLGARPRRIPPPFRGAQRPLGSDCCDPLGLSSSLTNAPPPKSLLTRSCCMSPLPANLVCFPREFDLSRASQTPYLFFPQEHLLVRRGTHLNREKLVDSGDFQSCGPVLTHMQPLHVLKVQAYTPACTRQQQLQEVL